MFPASSLAAIITTFLVALIITYILNKLTKKILGKKYNIKETAFRAFIYDSIILLIIFYFFIFLRSPSFSEYLIMPILVFAIFYMPFLLIYLIADIKKAKIKELNIDKISLDHETKRCPECAETVKLEARKCRFCGHLFDEEELKRQVEERKTEILKNEMASKGLMQCPQCGKWDVYKDYMPDGSVVDWCPHCEESLQNMKK